MQAASSHCCSRPHTSTCGVNTSMVQGQELPDGSRGEHVVSTSTLQWCPQGTWCPEVQEVCCCWSVVGALPPATGHQLDAPRWHRAWPADGLWQKATACQLQLMPRALPHAACLAACLPGRLAVWPPGCLAGHLAASRTAACRCVQGNPAPGAYVDGGATPVGFGHARIKQWTVPPGILWGGLVCWFAAADCG